MADAITGFIGAVLMVVYMGMIAGKLAEIPLWICTIVGLALMLYAFWIDAWRPLINRQPK